MITVEYCPLATTLRALATGWLSELTLHVDRQLPFSTSAPPIDNDHIRQISNDALAHLGPDQLCVELPTKVPLLSRFESSKGDIHVVVAHRSIAHITPSSSRRTLQMNLVILFHLSTVDASKDLEKQLFYTDNLGPEPASE